MKNNKKLEVVIVIILSVLCLTGILFAVKTSRDTGDELLPKEGKELKNTVSTEVSTEETETTKENTETTEENTEATEETEETETAETAETEATEEETETEESTEETEISFEKGEPISKKDLEFPVYGYDNYIDYIKAGNDSPVYMLADNAKMIETGEFTLEPEDLDDDETNDGMIESTVRGIKLGDHISKIFEVYGSANNYDKYGRDYFSHDDRKDVDVYCYLFDSEETPNISYLFEFIVDQYGELIGLILEPIYLD